MSFRTKVNAFCATLPGSEVWDPWGGGHDTWKVGGKMYASMGAVLPGVSVKTADVETATMLIDAGVATKAKYFHRSWVTLPEDTEDDELQHRIVTSYDIIRSGLTKKAQAALPPREGAA